MSKNIPGITIVFSLSSSSKNVYIQTGFSMQLQRRTWVGTHQAVVQRYWKLLQVKPYVEGTCGRDVDIEMKFVESIEDVVTFRFEVLLKGNLEEWHLAGGTI
jgi:hypothetical protein